MRTLKRAVAEMYGSIDVDRVAADYANVLIPNEEVQYACKLTRDLFIITNLRVLSVDKQGLRGKKRTYDSLPLGKIGRFSVEHGGALGLVTVRVWSSGAGGEKLEVVLNKKADGEGLQKALAYAILQ